jgi:hypothetical protein
LINGLNNWFIFQVGFVCKKKRFLEKEWDKFWEQKGWIDANATSLQGYEVQLLVGWVLIGCGESDNASSTSYNNMKLLQGGIRCNCCEL